MTDPLPLEQRAKRAVDAALGWLSYAATPPDRRAPHRSLVTSLPKAGTNLLLKALDGLPGIRVSRTWLTSLTAPPPRRSAPTVPVGVDWPVAADAARVRRLLGRLAPGSVAISHVPHSRPMAEIARGLDLRICVIVRDPRDVALSLGPYVTARAEHFLHHRFRSLAPDDRFVAALTGVDDDGSGWGLRSLSERYRSVTAWARDPAAVLVRFEDLVGSRGGGDDGAQLVALRTLADHLGIDVEDAELERLGAGLFGGTDTFRRGQVGGWRDALTASQRQLADEQLGDLLVELGYGSSTSGDGP